VIGWRAAILSFICLGLFWSHPSFSAFLPLRPMYSWHHLCCEHSVVSNKVKAKGKVWRVVRTKERNPLWPATEWLTGCFLYCTETCHLGSHGRHNSELKNTSAITGSVVLIPDYCGIITGPPKHTVGGQYCFALWRPSAASQSQATEVRRWRRPEFVGVCRTTTLHMDHWRKLLLAVVGHRM